MIVYRDNVDYGSAATKRDAATTGREVAANLPAVTKTADPDYRITCVFVEAPPVCGGVRGIVWPSSRRFCKPTRVATPPGPNASRLRFRRS